MADNPQAIPPGGGGQNPAPLAAAPAKGGLASALPLLAVILLMPLAAWATIKFLLPAQGQASAETTVAQKKKIFPDDRDTEVPIPLTTFSILWMKGATPNEQGRIVYLNSTDEAKPEKIVVNIAGTEGKRYAVANLSILGNHPELLFRINDKKLMLRQQASVLLSSKTLDEMTRGAAFHDIFRAELIQHFNRILGPGTVQDVIVSDFLIQ
jgi:flagellar protein FliL